MIRLKIGGLSAIVLALAFFFTPFVQFLAGPLIISDPLHQADAIVVLGGGWETKGKLGSSTLERYHYGINLFQQGYGKYLIFSGGNLWGNPSEAEEMADMALSNGFSEREVIIEGSSETTWQNTLFVKKILLEKKLQSVVLVTSPYHSRRAKTMFTDKGVTVISAPVPDSEFYNAFGTDQLHMAGLVISEYIKLGLYQLHLTG
ncbi:YdcF family protein [Phosphitispora sp. TUW77]|uniref:YdcF family protein n=1 Tax=Phosphitispora sp. TUW77 TaxID=3152361 RepID=UPI003AB24B90